MLYKCNSTTSHGLDQKMELKLELCFCGLQVSERTQVLFKRVLVCVSFILVHIECVTFMSTRKQYHV